ncbi:MAG: HD family hydrolase, partial [Chloroflexi bacterium]|nr:HD family hydrolase [Chloroflexota bacterium]
MKLLNILMHGNQLKRTARTGWAQRGIPHAENVAAHSYGVIFAALILAQEIEAELDMSRLLAMAALHDLPEGLTTDIPTPAWRYLPSGIKTEVEREAMQEILGEATFAPQLLVLWEELHEAETTESRLVHDADKLDLHIQAFVYEEQFGNRQLAEFWTVPHKFYFPEAQEIYDELHRRRGIRSNRAKNRGETKSARGLTGQTAVKSSQQTKQKEAKAHRKQGWQR